MGPGVSRTLADDRLCSAVPYIRCSKYVTTLLFLVEL